MKQHRDKYFAKCEAAIQRWREAGPQPLNTIKRDLEGNPLPVLLKELHDEKDTEPKLHPADESADSKEPMDVPVSQRSFDEQVFTGEKGSGEQSTKAEDRGLEEADDEEKKVDYPEKPLDEPVEEQTIKVEGRELEATGADEKEGVESEEPLEKEAEVSEENSNTAEPELEGVSTDKPEAVGTDEPVEQESKIAKDDKVNENTIDEPVAVDTEKLVEPETEDEMPDEVTIDTPEAVDTDKAQEETEEKPVEAETTQPSSEEEKEYNSGIWLFTDRENITHFFEPNFLPPYTTPEKRKIIMDVLREEWDENTLSWKPAGQGSMTKIGLEVTAINQKAISDDCDVVTDACGAMNPVYDKLDVFFGEVISQVHACCTPSKANVKQLED
jgi:hypothetical protein